MLASDDESASAKAGAARARSCYGGKLCVYNERMAA